MTPLHREIEAHMRDLLAADGMPPPDRIIDEPRSVGFVWEEPRVVMFVDFDGES